MNKQLQTLLKHISTSQAVLYFHGPDKPLIVTDFGNALVEHALAQVTPSYVQGEGAEDEAVG